MKRILIAALMVLLCTPAFAQQNPHVAHMISVIESEGYVVEEVERTWLGRIRIESRSRQGKRETVINRFTGEVLRDIWSRPGDTDRDARASRDALGATDDARHDGGKHDGVAGGLEGEGPDDDGPDGDGSDGGHDD